MPNIERQISNTLRRAAREYPAVVLTGARQVGKTTVMRETFPDHQWVSLDLPSRAEQAEHSPALFLQAHPGPLLIDEAQYAPGLFRHLKAAIDDDRHQMGRFLLTGSQKFVLMREVADSLAGRARIMTLEPLSFAELKQSGICDSKVDWPLLLARGFYPELWRQPAMHAADFYASYVATYLERDVRQLLNVHNLRDFERFLRAAAARSAQLLNVSELARDVGIKPHTARDWLSVLEASGQIFLLEPYFENVGKRIVKSPKLYLGDPGLLCFLLGLDAAALARGALVGPVWETLVYAELRKQLAADTESAAATLWFYRDAQGQEIDFLRVRGGTIDLIEAKWAESPDQRWQAALERVASVLAKSRINAIGRKLLVCRVASPRSEAGVEIGDPGVI